MKYNILKIDAIAFDHCNYMWKYDIFFNNDINIDNNNNDNVNDSNDHNSNDDSNYHSNEYWQ